jgi:CHRD domain
VRKLGTWIVAGALLSLVLAAVAVGAAQTTHNVSAKLTPGADVPKPVGATGASGSFTGTYVEKKNGSAVLKWKLSYSGLTGPALQAHIHLGKVGVSGNVILPLCGPCHSGMTGTATITKSTVEALEQHKTYVNVHTKKNPAGEIRGQIKVAG